MDGNRHGDLIVRPGVVTNEKQAFVAGVLRAQARRPDRPAAVYKLTDVLRGVYRIPLNVVGQRGAAGALSTTILDAHSLPS